MLEFDSFPYSLSIPRKITTNKTVIFVTHLKNVLKIIFLCEILCLISDSTKTIGLLGLCLYQLSPRIEMSTIFNIYKSKDIPAEKDFSCNVLSCCIN